MTMMSIIRIGLCLALTFAAAGVSAERLYKHVDKDGRVTYLDHPPTGGGQVEERIITNRPQSDKVDLPDVVLFVTPGCDPCDLARLYLKHRNVTFTEKDANNNPAVQAELKKAAGVLSVPTILVGKTVLKGFDKSQVDNALNAAGFPKKGTAQPESKPETPPGGYAPTR